MEDYIRGLLCGYLTVQNGTRDESKRRRIFVVLSDSRMDYYLVDPRPEFTAKIAETYIFKPGATCVNYYGELYPRAPPHSICLTTDKITDVFVAESENEATLWHDHLSERLEGLKTMVRGTLMIRKELAPNDHIKRFAFKTKYRWKLRYVELGRASLRFAKASGRHSTMKQFTLTATSFAGEEGSEFFKRAHAFASYSIPVVPSARVVRQIERNRRAEAGEPASSTAGLNTTTKPRRVGGVSMYYPFIISTGEAFLYLAAPTEQAREEWITAIRMRIISLKYRHNYTKGVEQETLPKLQGFVEASPKPGEEWKRRWVELDNGILRVKANDRRIGSIVETRLLPTCQVIQMLNKANAFVVRNLGQEIALAPAQLSEATQWMQTISEAAKGVDRVHYQKAFEDDIHQLLKCSVVYTLTTRPGQAHNLILEKFNKRVFVLNHQPTHEKSLGLSFLSKWSKGESGQADQMAMEDALPRGSVLVGVQQFGMLYDTFENMWHKIRQRRTGAVDDRAHQLRLIFRAPIVKEGVAGIKYREDDEWETARCRLANGSFRVACRQKAHCLVELSLRYCLVDLVSDVSGANCIKITCTIPSSTGGDGARTVVFVRVDLDADAFLWFAFLSLEASIARDGSTFPVVATTLNRAAIILATKHKRLTPSHAGYTSDQQRAFRHCTVVGNRIKDIEANDRVNNELALESSSEHCAACNSSNPDESNPVVDKFKAPVSIGDQPTAVLTTEDASMLFKHLDTDNTGKVEAAELMQIMERMTRHLRLDIGGGESGAAKITALDDFLSEFCSALDYQSPESRLMEFNDFNAVLQKIRRLDVAELIRRTTRNELHFM